MRRASVIGAVMLNACSGSHSAAVPASTDSAIEVCLFRDGHIKIDGRATKLAEVPAALDAAKGDAVAYYREGGDGEPSGEQSATIEPLLNAIMNKRLPIRLSSKPAFSDCVDDKRHSHKP